MCGTCGSLDRCTAAGLAAQHGVRTDDVARNKTEPGLRAAFDDMLRETRKLNDAARHCPAWSKPEIAVETALIATIARRLTERLQNNDHWRCGETEIAGSVIRPPCWHYEVRMSLEGLARMTLPM